MSSEKTAIDKLKEKEFMDESRLSRECDKLDTEYEQQLADEGLADIIDYY